MLGQCAAFIRIGALRHGRALAVAQHGTSGSLHDTPHATCVSAHAAYSTSSSDGYETIKVEVEDAAGKIIISRPKALNAVSSKVWQWLSIHHLYAECSLTLP